MNIYNEEKEYYIYKITNLINMKCYIGRTCDFERRMKEHQREDSHCTKLRNAVQKHGWYNFTIEILEHCIGDKLTAEREKYNIWLYESFGDFGYNLTTGGENCIVSEESKLKNSISNSGENSYWYGKNRPEHSEFMSGKNNPNYGKFSELHHCFGVKQTEEHRLKNSGENHWCYGKTGELSPNYGRKRSEEFVLNQSGEKSNLYGKFGEEHPCYGRKHNEEQTLNQSKRQRKLFLITFPDGHQEIINNLKQFCIDNNLAYSSMVCVANGTLKSNKKFKCEHYIETIL